MKRNLFSELKEGLDALKAEREGKVTLHKTVVTANPHIGSSFDDFLREEGRLEESTKTAMKRIKKAGR